MWSNPQETAVLVRLTGEMLNGKLHFGAVMQAFSRIFRDIDVYPSIPPYS